MANGIQVQGVVVFITIYYHDKVIYQKLNDNCKLKFDYVPRAKTGKLLTVVMEKNICNASKWTR